MKPEAVHEFYRRLAAATPAPETELQYENVFQLLVAVVLSAQATDAGVNRATGPLFAQIRTPAEMAALGEERLRGFIKTIGLFNTKAKNVIALSKLLVERHGGEVPRTRDELQALPGVGRKTANVVLGDGFGITGITVDTHVGRLSRRLGLTRKHDPVKVEMVLNKLVPQADWTRFSHRLILHGRAICAARKPLCEACPLAELCPRIGVPKPANGAT